MIAYIWLIFMVNAAKRAMLAVQVAFDLNAPISVSVIGTTWGVGVCDFCVEMVVVVVVVV